MEGKQVYLDHGATTRLREEVLEAIIPYLTEYYGNPSSLYTLGRHSRLAVEQARGKAALALGAEPDEIYFTSGGTEANNIALRGAAALNPGSHIITSSIEHPAVLKVCKQLSGQGYEVVFLPVDRHGMVSLSSLEAAITPRTGLISIMFANNEVGTIQPVEEIGKLARARGIYLHSDAVQAVGQLPVKVNKLQVDFLSLSAHKFNGPKGSGALYIRRGINISPLQWGGGQERRMRPGTENVPGIVGLGRAIELADKEFADKSRHLIKLRDRLITGLLKLEGTVLNGHPKQRLPGNANISFLGLDGEVLLLSLDHRGVAVSAGSACSSGSREPSHVLTAMGIDPAAAFSSLRFSLGRENTEEEIDYVLDIISLLVSKLRDRFKVGF
ncbi:MAG TPA: IscS subfamily cysteine desulfurase [Firmicutes bacterium]|nr:IscS subfamily cysteine desulfurase [Bacillota bacterium]